MSVIAGIQESRDRCFSLKETTVLRIGVYLVDVLDEAHGYTFIADTYSGSDGNQPGVIDVKSGSSG